MRFPAVRQFFEIKNIAADVRTTVISMLTVGALAIIGPIAGAIWKAIQKEPIQWGVFSALVLVGIALVAIAILKLNKAHFKKNNGLREPIAAGLSRISRLDEEIEKGRVELGRLAVSFDGSSQDCMWPVTVRTEDG